MSEEVFALLREAVNLARERGIRTVAQLRKALEQRHQGCSEDIDAALKFWAEQATGSAT